jgi:transcriptional regulator with XRE-family HTH domain
MDLAGSGTSHGSGLSPDDRMHPLELLRLARGLTRREVHEASGVSPTTQWEIETRRCQPRRATKTVLAAAYDVSAEALFDA